MSSAFNSSAVLAPCLRRRLLDRFNAVEVPLERDKRLSRINKLHITGGIFDFSKFAPLLEIVRNLNLVFFPLGRIESNTTEADVVELDRFLLISRYSVQIKNRSVISFANMEPRRVMNWKLKTNETPPTHNNRSRGAGEGEGRV